MLLTRIYGILGILLLVSGMIRCQPADKDNIFMAEEVEKVWKSEAKFKTPECVLHDAKRDMLYVSNMEGDAQKKDKKGFIAKVKPNGSIQELKWVAGLNAPKGMALKKELLYVSDIDQVLAINVENGDIKETYNFPEAKFLNDVAIDQQGRVYVTDMYDDRIYRITNQEKSTWSDHEALNRPNGLYFHDDRLYVGNNDALIAFQTDNAKMNKVGTGTGPIDGLIALGDRRFLTTDWQGRLHIHHYGNQEQSVKKLLDTREADQNAADMGFMESKTRVFIPTFSDNRVVAYDIQLEEGKH